MLRICIKSGMEGRGDKDTVTDRDIDKNHNRCRERVGTATSTPMSAFNTPRIPNSHPWCCLPAKRRPVGRVAAGEGPSP